MRLIGANLAQTWWFFVGAVGVVFLAVQTGQFNPQLSDPSSVATKLGLTRPWASKSDSHMASFTSVFRPGTFLTCAALASSNSNQPSNTFQTGTHKTTIASRTTCVQPQWANHLANFRRLRRCAELFDLRLDSPVGCQMATAAVMIFSPLHCFRAPQYEMTGSLVNSSRGLIV